MSAVWLLSALCLWEFYSFFECASQNLLLKIVGIFFSFLIVTHELWGISILAVLLGAFWTVHLYFLMRFKKSDFVLSENQFIITGLLYIPLAFQFFLRLTPQEIFFVLLASFLSDSGAFYGGSLWGKRKIWEGISPKKTWIGSASGMCLCLGGCLLYGNIFGALGWYHWIWIGILLNLAAQFGDFFESAVKRKYEIKDSGRLLPGHGGLLDRFDSVLLVLPVFMLLRVGMSPFITG
jgi:phosphatidate cytidylyltransferase